MLKLTASDCGRVLAAFRQVSSRVATAGLAVAGILAPHTLVAQSDPPPTPPRIRLVLQLTVDQMRGDYIDRYKDQYKIGRAHV